MSQYLKPLPNPTPTSRPFWEAARRHELSLQRCAACGKFIYYPRDRCPYCFSDRLEWKNLSGRGKVYSYTVVRRASSFAFADTPYVLAIVELEEGPRMTSDIVAPPENVRVEMPVEVYFDDVTPEHTLVKFKPA
ncbi:MAG TPA: Zn-ribbon domain-containing OB-fold protein [Candidatus Binataceae bacterium]|nr:Zn-ribbon domain-containing OB-fold protein [Candidatus Binataceae bacterium]